MRAGLMRLVAVANGMVVRGRLVRVAVLGGIVLASAAGVTSSGGAQSTPNVKLAVFRTFDSGNNIHRFRFRGSISSRAAGEYVAVMQQKCGYSFGTAIAGAQTTQGGVWEAETSHAARPGYDTSTYFARWGSVRSAPVKFRGKLFMTLTKLGKGRFRVYVWRGSDALQDMTGREVVLQRLVDGRWTRIGAARLKIDPAQYSSYAVTFVVKTRGWSLRAFVPAKNARPCFNQSATERWES